jgi:maltose alpha-D-glucosyltransferase/alpha-amylase
MDPVYGFQAVNVEASVRDTSSFLRWMRSMLAVRRRYQVFGEGSFEFIEVDNPSVLAYVRRPAYADDNDAGQAVLCVCNLSARAQPADLDVRALAGLTPVELTGDTEFPVLGDAPYRLSLAPYGFFWFRLDAGRVIPDRA